MADGVSPNGVRSIEQVTFLFPAAYPLRAPLLTLRHDFDRALAHVQPGDPGDPPEPCIVDGRPSELLQQRGLFGIVDQLARWLENAALERLIDPEHGWEPVRRDSLDDVIVADAAHLRGLVTRQAGRAVLRFDYLRFGRPDEEKSTYGIIDCASMALNTESLKKLLSESNLSGSDDTFIPKDSPHNLNNGIENSVHHVIQDAGHVASLENPTAVNQYIEDFLKTL
jgi:pimeloyl-ACP methyl ester carboxylesterase